VLNGPVLFCVDFSSGVLSCLLCCVVLSLLALSCDTFNACNMGAAMVSLNDAMIKDTDRRAEEIGLHDKVVFAFLLLSWCSSFFCSWCPYLSLSLFLSLSLSCPCPCLV
jgi:hypothetical protein